MKDQHNAPASDPLARLGAIAIIVAGCCSMSAFAQDGQVNTARLSHITSQDLRPLAPQRGDATRVRFQAVHDDLTAARVHWDLGIGSGTAEANVVARLGVYDVWEAALPTTFTNTVDYVIEAIDADASVFMTPNGLTGEMPAESYTLNFQTFSHAPYGASPSEDGTFFKVWAPGASSAHVRGSFNNWSLQHPMQRVGEDFVAFVSAAEAGDSYKFFFNGNLWKEDARARWLDQRNNNNSVIVDPLAFEPEHTAFVPAPLEEWVIYQLHIGTFAGRNDPFGAAPTPARYVDVIPRIAHLQELGVNAVMLNPVHEFPSERSGGYNPTTMFGIESSYGTQTQFRQMIDALHGAGIAVILDVVYNHFDGFGNFLWNYDGSQIFYDTPNVDTAWGPQADFDRGGVFDYFVDAGEYMLGELGVDGFRFDAVHAMTDGFSTPQFAAGQDVLRRVHENLRRRHAGAVSIAEIYNDSAWVTAPTSSGLGFDGMYHNRYKNAVRGAVFDAAFGDPNVSELASAVNGTGGAVGRAALNYFALHDDVWPLSGHDRAVREIDTSVPHDDEFATSRVKLGEGITMLARGVPAIVQGSEWLEDAPWEFEKIDWAHKTQYGHVFRYFQDLIAMRTTKRALFASSPSVTRHVNEAANVFSFERFGDDGRKYLVVANFSNDALDGYRLGIPTSGRWGVVLNSEARRYGGSGDGSMGRITVQLAPWDGLGQSAALDLPARGLLVLQQDPEYAASCNPSDVAAPVGVLNAADVNAFVNAFISGAGGDGDLNGDGVRNASDISVFIAAWLTGR
ncbi:MAG: alpha-amylase family glycosyl hydrolase [Planctomycetota bacterium]